MHELHLAIEAIGVRYGGGATVLRDLVDAAIGDCRFGRVSIFCSPKQQREFPFPESDKVHVIDVPIAQASPVHRLFWLNRTLPRRLASIGADVLVSLSGTGRGSSRTPHIPFIQQSLPFTPEALATMGFRDRFRVKTIYYAMKFSCRTSAEVLVQTNTMRRAVINSFRLEPANVRTVSYSVRAQTAEGGDSPRLQPMRQTAPGYRLLYVGNESTYKNVGTLLTAVKELAESFPGMRLFLTWPENHPAGNQEHAVCMGYLNDAEVREAYRLADLLVMPSLAETVGLPLLEAMTSGTPVLAADRPYANEICEDAADYFDPLDWRSLSAGIRKLLEDGAHRRELSRRGLALSQRQRDAQPYQQMLDSAAAVAWRSG